MEEVWCVFREGTIDNFFLDPIEKETIFQKSLTVIDIK